MTVDNSAYYDSYTGRYPIRRTVQFSLIPQGETQKWIDQYGFVSADEKRDEDYKELKKIIDNYHRDFIARALDSFKKAIDWNNLIEALEQFQQSNETDKPKARKELEKVQANYQSEIAEAFRKQDDFNSLFKKDLITKILPDSINDEDKNELLARFRQFTSYFTGFNENRQNLYSDEAKATAISHRIVNENFPRFYANCKDWERLNKLYHGFGLQVQDSIEKLDQDIDIAQYFEPKNYSLVLTQEGIDVYNMILGGGFDSSRKKVSGLNNLANECWQKARSNERNGSQSEGIEEQRAPHKIILQQLHRQILSENVSSWSQLFEQYKNDGEVYDALKTLNKELLQPRNEEVSFLDQVVDLFRKLKEFDPAVIQVRSNRFFSFSRTCFGDGFYLENAIASCVDEKLAPVQGLSASARNKWAKKEQRTLREIAQIVYAAEKSLKAKDADAIDLPNEQVWEILHVDNLIEDFYETRDEIVVREERLEEDLTGAKPDARKLMQKGELVQKIKAFLDSLLNYQRALQVFSLDANEERNPEFYAYYDSLRENWSIVPQIYDRVRNYVTQKPYSKEKFKLTFENPSFLNGWSLDKQDENYGALFLQDGKYYLGILNPNNKIKFESLHDAVEDKTEGVFQKVDYNLFPGATKMIPKCSIARNDVKNHFRKSKSDCSLDNEKFIKPLRIPYRIMELNYDMTADQPEKLKLKKYQVEYKRSTGDEAGFTEALADWIDFCLDFLESYRNTAGYDFSFCHGKEYKSLDQFYNDVDRTTYSLSLRDVSKRQIDQLISDGKLFFFQLYNKDFAEKATGKKNLHTLYFEALFSKQNLNETVFKLDGEAEMFYRPASIDSPFTHNVGEYVVNRTYIEVIDGKEERKSLKDYVHRELYEFANGKKAKSKLSKDAIRAIELGHYTPKEVTHAITRDKRFSQPQYSLHIPLTINFGTKPIGGRDNNSDILKSIKRDKDIAIIGIDRGERNLLYYSVIDQAGKILDQGSLNAINGVDYHEKLDLRERERNEQRQSWKSIDKIKDLKKGYLSVAVHEIVSLMLKHNAVIVMEDLNAGFKRSRTKFEKQIYQNFEKQLIDKLNYCVIKPKTQGTSDEASNRGEHRDLDAPGGVLCGYQLANQFESFQKLGKQCGSIFYVPAWNTSRIDPTTGFVNLFRAAELRYKNLQQVQSFFQRFDGIRFNKDEDWFEFTFSYSNFNTSGTSLIDEWTVCARDVELPIVVKDDNEGRWNRQNTKNETINIKNKLEGLFAEYGIDYKSGEDLIEAITSINHSGFYKELLQYFKTLIALRYSTKAGTTPAVDCIVSPVMNEASYFFDSREASPAFPQDADANGAYNIALKGLQIAKEFIDEATDAPWRVTYKKSNNEWLRFVQERAWKNQ